MKCSDNKIKKKNLRRRRICRQQQVIIWDIEQMVEWIMDMDFFGSYVKNTKVIPSVKESYEERAKQREIFEIIDDYIEQA